MTPERIAELRALADAATPGPWSLRGNPWHPDDLTASYLKLVDSDNRDLMESGDNASSSATLHTDDAHFIAAARTALPEALDVIEWVRTQCELWLHYPEDYVPLNKVAEMILAALEGKSDG